LFLPGWIFFARFVFAASRQSLSYTQIGLERYFVVTFMVTIGDIVSV
jgi:hypothetical protein